MKKRLEKAFYWVCWKLVWIFYPKTTVEGTENLPEEPSIVVGNHSQANGPILAELYFPGKRAIWCAGQMMSAKEIPDYAYHDFWDEKPKVLKPLFRLLSYIIAPFASCVMRATISSSSPSAKRATTRFSVRFRRTSWTCPSCTTNARARP